MCAGALAALVGCAAAPAPPAAAPTVEVPKATATAHDTTPPAADEPPKATQPPAARSEESVAEHAAQPPPIEPRKTVASRVLAELHRARADDARAKKLRNEQLMKRLQPLPGTVGQGGYGRVVGGLGLRGSGYGTGHGSGHGTRAGGGGAGVGILGMLSNPRTTTLELRSVRGPLTRSQISWKLRTALAVRGCARGNAWATFELTIDKGAVTRAHVGSSQPATAKFRSCTEHILGRLHFASAGKTVVRATLRVSAK